LEEFVADALEADRAAEYNLDRSRWTAKVGARPQYSSFGLALAGLVVAAQNPEGLSFSEYVAREITEPLGMRSTAIVPNDGPGHLTEAMRARISTGYARFDELLLPTPLLQSADHPSVSLLTTPGDQLRLLLALMHGGATAEGRILQPSSVRWMLTPQVEMTSFTPHDPWSIGLVAELHGDQSDVDRFFGHGGAHPWGWYSDCRAYPDRELAVVVLTNKWDMLRWHNPAVENAHGFINGFVLDQLDRGAKAGIDADAGNDLDLRMTWDAKASYLIGVLMAERIHGFLGVAPHLEQDELRAMGTGGRFVSSADLWAWDQGAFEAGYLDLLAAGTTPGAIRSFLGSEDLAVVPTELRLLCHTLDRRGRAPIPMPFFAGSRGGAPAGKASHERASAAVTADAALG
jgi:hypothetical protein